VAKLENMQIDAAAFLADLLNAVCILQRDGLKIVFSHRSFQEYFCAYRLARFPEKQVGELIKRFAFRNSDNVIPMLFDMDNRLVNRTYVYPGLKKYKELTERIGYNFKLTEFIQSLDANIMARYVPGHGFMYASLGPGDNELVSLMAVVKRLSATTPTEVLTNIYQINPPDEKLFRQNVLPLIKKETRSRCRNFLLKTNFTYAAVTIIDNKFKANDHVFCGKETADAVASWLNRTRLADDIRIQHSQMLKLCTDLEKDQASQNKSLNEILGVSS
jgi:hypothetical protein